MPAFRLDRVLVVAVLVGMALALYLVRSGGAKEEVKLVRLSLHSGYAGNSHDMAMFTACWAATARKSDTTTVVDWQKDIQPTSEASGASAKLDKSGMRLGLALPKSYHYFIKNGGADLLQYANMGFPKGQGVAKPVGFFLNGGEVDYFRIRNKRDAEVWSAKDYRSNDPQTTSIYDNSQDSVDFWGGYIDGLIVLGDDRDGAFYLLNPNVTLADGEWEAWYLDSSLPGAFQFPSFAHLLLYLYRLDMAGKSQINDGVFPFGAPPKGIDTSCEPYLKVSAPFK